MLCLIDNYDSFVYNLARYFVELGCETQVIRNDAITVAEIRELGPAAIVISPGPCTPLEAGISLNLIRELSDSIPILGVCLGHQAIAAAFGGQVVRALEPVHGRASLIEHSQTDLFAELPNPLRVARYHSLVVDEPTLPRDLIITARTADGVPMAMRHRTRRLYGVQFHPESVLTQFGRPLLANFLRLAGVEPQPCWISDWQEPVTLVEADPFPPLTW